MSGKLKTHIWTVNYCILVKLQSKHIQLCMNRCVHAYFLSIIHKIFCITSAIHLHILDQPKPTTLFKPFDSKVLI